MPITLCNNMHMALKFVILTLLHREPQSGYQIVRSFDSAFGYFWSASHQQVYRELAGLSESGLVNAKLIKQLDKPDKKIYTISVGGVDSLETWLEAPVKPQATRDPLLVKLMNANLENYQSMIHELALKEKESIKLLTVYNGIESQYYSPAQRQKMPAADNVLYIALRKGILGLKAHLEWLNEAMDMLRDIFK